MDKTVLYDLSYGLYAIGVKDGDRDCGCIVNTVFQVTSADPLIAISLNKDNYTAKLVEKNKRFSVSILSEQTSPTVIQELGFISGKDNCKWDKVSHSETNQLPVVSDHANGFMICEVVNSMDANTHIVFLAKVIDAKKDALLNPMTYTYYHNVIKGKAPKNAPTYQEAETSSEKKWVCSVCGYVYDGPDFEAEPDTYVCPICKQPKSVFELR